MFFILGICLLLSCCNQDSQTLCGTFIYGSVCKDGIVFVADSRANFLDNGESQFYFDGVKKIFVVNEFVIAFSGNIRVNNHFPEHFLSELETYKSNSPIELIQDFARILKKELGKMKFKEEIVKFNIYAGGYDKTRGMPLICGLKDGNIHYNNRGSVTNHNVVRDGTKLSKLSFKKAIKLMKKDIEKYTNKMKLDWEIGGDKTVVTISKGSNPICEESCDNLVWENWSELKEYLKNNIDTVNLTNCSSNDKALQILNKH